MRRAVRFSLCLALAVAGLFGMCSPAIATDGPDVGGECRIVDLRSGTCSVHVSVPGGEGAPDTDGIPVGYGGSDGGSADSEDGSPCFFEAPAHVWLGPWGQHGVDCVSEYGTWAQDLGCYLSPMDPQPPAGDPAWAGHEPGDGAVYECVNPLAPNLNQVVWLATPPEVVNAPAPGVVARQAVAQMSLRAIEIGAAPPPGAMAVVGVPVWLWVADPGATTFGENTATASVGGVTVTATARASEVRWDLGDGTTTSCGAGTPYEPHFGGSPSPDCGHVFTRESGFEPGGAYTVTASTTWVVDWAGAGQTGTITLDPLVAELQVVVAEGQVLVS
ncbi:hypothetical protein L1785_22410 [Antribacter sp. KLBMP9083]|uniref:PKD domain-containing protein n=1 Tax=Antribacter soli TaxID=2910976 RepID=A0AA41QK32_9MICO|nr:hypothetical protein [Antribacter soli]MCF4123717.1 hypothetical protein [Antribacter soli]